MTTPDNDTALGTGAKDKYDSPEEEAAAARLAGLPVPAQDEDKDPAPPAAPAAPAAPAPSGPPVSATPPAADSGGSTSGVTAP